MLRTRIPYCVKIEKPPQRRDCFWLPLKPIIPARDPKQRAWKASKHSSKAYIAARQCMQAAFSIGVLRGAPPRPLAVVRSAPLRGTPRLRLHMCICRTTVLRVSNLHRATTRAQSPQRVHFRCSQCPPRHSESDPTHPKSAEGSPSMFQIRAAPQRERSNTPKSAEGSLSIFTMSTAPQRERSNTPQKVHFRCSQCAPRHATAIQHT